jgi:predicted amidohydrolase
VPGFTLAIGQAPADLPTVVARLDWLRGILPGVAGVDLLLMPELFACGYSIGDAVQDRAEHRDGPTAAAVAALAEKTGVAIHYGYAERDGAALFNAAQCFGPDGARLTHQRKLLIPPGFEGAHFTPGQGCALFAYRGLRIATLICYDAEFPETVRHVAGLGADLVLVPTALGAQWRWVSHTLIPARAYENGVFVAYANSAGAQNGMAFLGESVVAGPDGAEIARAGADPQVLLAGIEAGRITAARARLPYLVDRRKLTF